MKIERQLQGTLNTVFTEIIKEKGLDKRLQPYPALEEHRADITLKNSVGRPIFFIELKDPTANDGKSVFDGNVLMREMERAQRIDIKYFGNCNFLACAFFDRDKMYDKVSVNEGFFTLLDIVNLSRNYSPTKEINIKLRKIAEFYIERAIEVIDSKPIKFNELDELFIFKIRKLIEVYSQPIAEKIWEEYKNNKQFEKELNKYAQSQLWNKPQLFTEVEKLSHISILMLISKLIFYKTYVDNQTWHELSPMKVPDGTTNASDLENIIWQYFDTFKEVTGNFELLVGEKSDIIFRMPFLSDETVNLVKDILETEGHYNFSNIPFDVIGRIFEELIREDERHKLGQYFTPPHVIDLINSFAIRRSNDKVFDPSCGSGTFLVRAYERKKNLCNQEGLGVRHKAMLDEIYGNDISNYPAYLSMLNLAIRDTRHPSYPRVANKDFFEITETSRLKLHNQDGKEERKILPKFNAIIGNPPYTRQEDIGTLSGTVKKNEIQGLIKSECGFEPSQRTSIYSYFFYHASAFLTENGYLAYICQNSWLDTDYGIDMQRYLMRAYEILYIIDSEVERFFPSASVNTTIVILRKQRDEDKRNNNTVKFVYFTSPLSETIRNHKGIEELHDALEDIIENAETPDFRMNCVKQKTLADFTKWGQFLKAPKIYFDILEKGKDKFKPLSKFADVKFGLKTGCNEFFIIQDITNVVTDKDINVVVFNPSNYQSVSELKKQGLRIVKNGFNEYWLIESKFISPFVKSSREIEKYIISETETINNILILTDEEAKSIEKYKYLNNYIKSGIRKEIHKRPTCASRKNWFVMDNQNKPDLSFNRVINDFGRTYKGEIFYADVFNNIHLKSNSNQVWYYLNSTISWLIQQIFIRSNFGDGAGEIKVYELADFPTPEIDLGKLNIDLGETKNYKEELGNLTDLSTVNPERVKLDSAILEAIGYTDKEERENVLLELYRATYKLIDARLQKAQSQKTVKSKRNQVAFSVYMDELENLLQEKNISKTKTLRFARDLEKVIAEITLEHKLQKKIFDTFWKKQFRENYNEKEVANKGQGSLFG